MNFYLKTTQKPDVKAPILVEGLPGVGYVGRIAAKHLVSELDAKKFAILHSDYFPPQVLIKKSGRIHTMKNEFYYWKAKEKNQKDIIIVTGNTQGMSPEGQYALTEKILDIVDPYKVDTIYTLGGLGIGRIVEKPKVFGAVTHRKFIPELEKRGVVVR
ncbi:MAG: PAC2 family protein, partial [Candidatus Hydrothermarchaeaceae archaeon]